MKPISLILLWCAFAAAQAPPPAPDTLVSPEVHPDGRVTFRVRAPKAAEVAVAGDWMPANGREPMRKDAEGVWSVTLGPLPPSIYLYTFALDGVTVADPVNPRVKLRSRTSASLVEVPAHPPALWQARDVPHGKVEIQWQRSSVLNGDTRWIWIYTPPGYGKQTSRRYPVLYLLHGSNDTAAGWTLAGSANMILDNLIAEGKAAPMIVVMPYGHAVPYGAPREQQAKNTELMEQYLLKDVAPLVEADYRVATGRENRAIAGFSMGGGHALAIGFGHLDRFSAIGAFSSAVPADFETKFAGVLSDAQATNAKLKLLWLGCGRQDFIWERSSKLHDLLTARKISHTFRATEGAHTYTVWRQYLSEFAPLLFQTSARAAVQPGTDRVTVENGVLESGAARSGGVRAFKGIPFAKPPAGELRWREPQPVENWTGVRKAADFGPRCMQQTGPGADYWFRSNGMSEDCLYLNVWTPAKSGKERLPVLVYVFGGGFQNGDGSEPRYDGENMARKGIVAVSFNYRTNIFGFFVHPELTRESPHRAAGNYGLLDQVAALRWVRKNIAAFGGDPLRITIAGESAGSISVSALMASPLSRDMVAGAIGESGSMTSSLPPQPLAAAEQNGLKFAASAGAGSLAELRAMSAEQIQEAMTKAKGLRFSTSLDGYFLPKPLISIYEAGEQAKAPLLAGSNTHELPPRVVLGDAEPTPENLANAIRKLYGENAGAVVKAYAANTADEVWEAAAHLASARFVSFSTWKWTELHMKTGGKPVYRYLYARPRPDYLGMPGEAPPPAPAREQRGPKGAAHSAEIQYAMGNLDLDQRYQWEPADYEVSKTMQGYFVNFIKTGNPNGPGLPKWPEYDAKSGFLRMRIDTQSKAEPEAHRDRYLALEALPSAPGR